METATGGSGMKALITGITGQDGSYLAELLLEEEFIAAGRRAWVEAVLLALLTMEVAGARS